MSFRCADCGWVSKAGQMVVRETREKVYIEKHFEGGREIEVVVGSGTEIVREERVCLECIAESKKE